MKTENNNLRFSKRKPKSISVLYEHEPNVTSQEKLNEVYDMLFGEIFILNPVNKTKKYEKT